MGAGKTLELPEWKAAAAKSSYLRNLGIQERRERYAKSLRYLVGSVGSRCENTRFPRWQVSARAGAGVTDK